MKIAFCLHGISYGKNYKDGGLPVSFYKEAEFYHKFIIDKYNADCFYHTWESQFENEIFSIYKPKEFEIEKSKVFHKLNLIDYVKFYRKRFMGFNELHRRNNIISRWYSFQKTIQQVVEYEKRHNIKYDFVFISRFDMLLFKEIPFDKLDKNRFYVGDWYEFYDKNNEKIDENILFNNKNKVSKVENGYPVNRNGLSDFWFSSSLSIMKEISSIYYELDDLMECAGESNHKIILEKLKRMGMLENISKILEFSTDYYLTRWANKNEL